MQSVALTVPESPAFALKGRLRSFLHDFSEVRIRVM